MTDILEGFCQCGCGRKTTVSKQTARCYGYIKGVPRRFVKGHRLIYCPIIYNRKKSRTHGECVGKASREYQAWNRMIQRCHNSKHTSYHNYGSRGIKVCDEWRNSFESFLSAVGRKPDTALTLDRINNNGDYEPGNVRWTTRLIQNQNCRKNRILTHDGLTMCAAEWARRIGITSTSFLKRLKHPENNPFRGRLDR